MKWHPDGTVTVDVRLLVSLASMVVHAEEAQSPGGHIADWHAFAALRADPVVAEGMAELDRLAMLPVRRDAQ